MSDSHRVPSASLFGNWTPSIAQAAVVAGILEEEGPRPAGSFGHDDEGNVYVDLSGDVRVWIDRNGFTWDL